MSKNAPAWLQEIRDYWSRLVEEHGDGHGEMQPTTTDRVLQDYGDGDGMSTAGLQKMQEAAPAPVVYSQVSS